MKINFKTLAPLLVCAVMLSSCGSSGGSNYSSAPAEKQSAYDAATEEYSENEQPEDIDSGAAGNENMAAAKMIYTATVNLETLEYDNTVSSVKADIDKYGGFTESSSETANNSGWYRDDYVRSGDRVMDIVVRIPSESFSTFLSGLSSYGQKTFESTNAENVTRRYADNEAEIKALETEEERLLEMMESAETIDEMITVESRLTTVQSTLNKYKSELASLDSSIRFSTVTLHISEVHKYTEVVRVHEPTFPERLWDHITDSGKSFLRVMEGLLYVIIALFPYMVICAVIAAIVITISKKRRAKAPKAQPTPAVDREAAPAPVTRRPPVYTTEKQAAAAPPAETPVSGEKPTNGEKADKDEKDKTAESGK
ncbi:MAG: DUF4349 domain-containing protein [Oscillospiraceae bacterium]|nr:DUF4349 domain-containing protein [Oscillospiraceae bacterium]